MLIETITAAFEMEEMLYELREHAAGLNAGRWDYLFSLIKTFARHGSGFILPDRSQVTMTAPFMRAYTDLLVRTCHKRGAHAIGGMAACIPSRDDPAANEAALVRVRLDKEREAVDGFDGSWVAHPGLVPVCREAFESVLSGRHNQLDHARLDVQVSAADLLSVVRTTGRPTLEGLSRNIAVALRYFSAWLRGTGAVAIFGLVEEAATAEIARCQVWQWLHHRTPLAGGGTVTPELVRRLAAEEAATLIREAADGGEDGPGSTVNAALALFDEVALAPVLPPFFTTDAYARYLFRPYRRTAGARRREGASREEAISAPTPR